MGIPVLVELTAVRANKARKVLAVLEAKVLKTPESKLMNLFQILKRQFDVKISVDFKYASFISVAIHVGHFFVTTLAIYQHFIIPMNKLQSRLHV